MTTDNEQRKLPCKLTICKQRGGGEDSICIYIEDTASHIRFFEGNFSLTEFADALFGLGSRPGTCEIRGLENVGKKHQCKKVDVHIPYDKFSVTKEQIRYSLVPYEVDGWKACDPDATNSHNITKWNEPGGGYTVTVGFHRYVESEL